MFIPTCDYWDCCLLQNLISVELIINLKFLSHHSSYEVQFPLRNYGKKFEEKIHPIFILCWNTYYVKILQLQKDCKKKNFYMHFFGVWPSLFVFPHTYKNIWGLELENMI
jgi:hypothetical protein